MASTTRRDFAMPERCSATPEQVPRLEPLNTPDSGSVHDLQSTSTSHLPFKVDGSTTQKIDRDFSQMMRDVSAPLQLSLVLENRGNVARDHLASERTYLSYVRTSLACSSAGVALVQLLTLSSTSNVPTSGIDLNKFAKPLGATINLLGLILLIFGVFRYYTTQSALVRGYFPVPRTTIMLFTFILGALVVIVFCLILAGTEY